MDGTDGFRLDGVDAGDFSGISVAGGGDINGDGIDDLIVGASGAEVGSSYDAGESYVVFGTTSRKAATFNLSALDGTNGFRLRGADVYDESGFSVATAGDVNGDGFEDLIVGARLGAGYVVFGSSSGFAARLDVSDLNGTDGFRLDAVNGTYSVAGAGDFNGDGIDDLIIGTPHADRDDAFNAGASYLVFGKSTGFSASLDLSTLDGMDGFRLLGADEFDRSGASVNAAGDINQDGMDDLIIGAPDVAADGRSNSGQSYVVFGFRTSPPAGTVTRGAFETSGFDFSDTGSGREAGFTGPIAEELIADRDDDFLPECCQNEAGIPLCLGDSPSDFLV